MYIADLAAISDVPDTFMDALNDPTRQKGPFALGYVVTIRIHVGLFLSWLN
jgi:hypothetical protein